MTNSLEKDFLDFIQIQGLKEESDVAKVAAAFGLSEEELFEFVNERVVKLEEAGWGSQAVGEALGTVFLFGYWLRGVQ